MRSALAYEYVPDSEIGIMTGPSGSEEDLLAEKVSEIKILCTYSLYSQTLLNIVVFADVERYRLYIRHGTGMRAQDHQETA